MPYEAGERVIQEDEFGDPVYEDIGLTPDYVRLLRDKRDAIRRLTKTPRRDSGLACSPMAGRPFDSYGQRIGL
mgnify:CR=1 FL=1